MNTFDYFHFLRLKSEFKSELLKELSVREASGKI